MKKQPKLGVVIKALMRNSLELICPKLTELNINNVNNSINLFLNVTNTALSNHAPIKIKPKVKAALIDKHWITHVIRKSVKTKTGLDSHP